MKHRNYSTGETTAENSGHQNSTVGKFHTITVATLSRDTMPYITSCRDRKRWETSHIKQERKFETEIPIVKYPQDDNCIHSMSKHVNSNTSRTSWLEESFIEMNGMKDVINDEERMSIESQDNFSISSMMSSRQRDVLSRIATLKALCDQQFITEEEYTNRKLAIMDEITYASPPSIQSVNSIYSSNPSITSLSLSMTQPRQTRTRRLLGHYEQLPKIIPHAPNFQYSRPEVAIKHVFDYPTRQWHATQVYINLDEVPFDKGSLRVVYHLQDLTEMQEYEFDWNRNVIDDDYHTGTYVAKLAIDPDEDPQTYFRDIELQAHCAHYARMYNSYNPPKHVQFIKSWVLELTERNGTLCAVEPWIPGEYRKHNNNFGSVSEDERNTPQSFSHFTFEASNRQVLAVDIQGVGDLYTDPQIHTLNGDDFGKGNLGVVGFRKFLATHRCNPICRYLKLPPVNPKGIDVNTKNPGTMPLTELMAKEKINVTSFDSKHYYENAPLLQKYIAACRDRESRRQGVYRQHYSNNNSYYGQATRSGHSGNIFTKLWYSIGSMCWSPHGSLEPTYRDQPYSFGQSRQYRNDGNTSSWCGVHTAHNRSYI